MPEARDWFLEELQRRGVSRRDFLGFCGAMTTVLALPRSAGAKIAQAIENEEKPTLVWLEFQDCAGNTESFLRASRPTTADIILDTLSVDYHETIMAAAGHRAEEALSGVVEEQRGEYLVVVEGLTTIGSEDEFANWTPGHLDSLTAVGVWRVSGPEPTAGGAPGAPAAVSAEQLERLRALGYAE